MSSTVAPSFWDCLTWEFMKTVHRLPRLTGASANSARSANSAAVRCMERAKVSMKEPHPEEQASFSMIRSTAPFLILKHLMSCPPMSRMKSTSGRKNFAAV